MIKNLIILFASVISFFCSCRSVKKIQKPVIIKDTVAIAALLPVNHGKEDSAAFIKENYSSVLANHINFTTFSAKADIEYDDAEGKKYNVTAHVRMYKDSVIWVSITGPFGIEGLRAYITADSVKLLDKPNKLYITRSVSYLQEVTELPLNLASLQDLLIGNPVFLDSHIVSYNKSGNAISMQSMGVYFKNLFTIGGTDKLLQSSKLSDVNEQRNRSCYLTYFDYDHKKGIIFSTGRNINIVEKKQFDIKLDFKQYDFNETLSFPFSVPKNYKRN